MEYISKKQSKENPKLLTRVHPNQKKRLVGTVYSDCFDGDEKLNFYDGMPARIGIIWFRGGWLDSSLLPKKICPVCGKEKLILYFCVGSALSGCHTLKFHCLECKELFVAHDRKYFAMVQNFILDNPGALKKEADINIHEKEIPQTGFTIKGKKTFIQFPPKGTTINKESTEQK